MVAVNSAIIDSFILRDYANVPITGKVAADFTVIEAYSTGIPATTAPVTLSEIGAGEYGISFTPTTAASWTAHLVFDAGGVFHEYIEIYEVLSKPATVIVVPSDPSGSQLAAMTSQMITRGDSRTWNLPLVDETGNPFDLTGCSVWFSIKQRFNLPDADAVVSSSWSDGGASNGITVADPVSGWISFGITAEQSLDLVASLYLADVQVLDTAGVVRTVWKLRLAVSPGITEMMTISPANTMLFTRAYTAEGAIVKNRLVKFGSTDTQAIQASLVTDRIIGVYVGSVDAANGDPIDVCLLGECSLEVSGTIAPGMTLTTNASGQGINTTPPGNTNNKTAAMALVSGMNATIPVFVYPGWYQG